MRSSACVLSIAFLGLGAAAFGQNVATSLLESPYKIPAHGSPLDSVTCTLALAHAGESLFGLDRELGTDPARFVATDLLAPFTVYEFDEQCSIPYVMWNTAFAGPTQTGITVDEPGGGEHYWIADPFGTGSLLQFEMWSGLPGPADPIPFPAGFPGVWGSIAWNNNLPGGSIVLANDVAADRYVEVDMSNGVWGASFSNPDNAAGAGAFGNGHSEAIDPDACAGADYVVTSGALGEGMVVRASQIDAAGALCYNTWEFEADLAPFEETFINGFEEYWSPLRNERSAMLLGNATGVAYNITDRDSITRCQGIDSPDSDVLYVNAMQGMMPDYRVGIDNTHPLSLAVQKPPAGGPGKYVVHLDWGAPSAATMTTLPAALGLMCFPLMLPPFGSAWPACVWNNLGRTDRLGDSSYFTNPIAGPFIENPPRAPAFFYADAAGDPANWTLGGQFTLQGIIINPGSTSPKLASLTNAVVIDVTAGI